VGPAFPDLAIGPLSEENDVEGKPTTTSTRFECFLKWKPRKFPLFFAWVFGRLACNKNRSGRR
jgi:hypothetical protein